MQKEITSKQKLLNNLANFFQKYRILIAIILLALLLGVVAVGIMSEIKKNKIENAIEDLYPVEKSFNEWTALAGEKKAEEKDSLIRELDKVIDGNKGTYAAQRAMILKAGIFYDLDDYEAAIANYENLSNTYPDSVIAPNALFSIAACYEELDNSDKALEYYNRVADEFSFESALAPHALYNTGRIYAVRGKRDEALEAFNEVLDAYPNSNWTNSSRTSIIQLAE